MSRRSEVGRCQEWLPRFCHWMKGTTKPIVGGEYYRGGSWIWLQKIMRLFLRHLSGTAKQAVKYTVWHIEEMSSSPTVFSPLSPFHFSYYCLWIPWKQGWDKDLGAGSLSGSWFLASRNEGPGKWDKEGGSDSIMCITEVTTMDHGGWILPEPFHVPEKHWGSLPELSSWRNRG